MSIASWIEGAPMKAGTYLVANENYGYVAQARYKPRNKEWKFPSAALAFEVTHWDEMPSPPKPIPVVEQSK